MLAQVSVALRGRAKVAHPGPLETPVSTVVEGGADGAADGPDGTADMGLLTGPARKADTPLPAGLEAAFAERFAANGGESVTTDPQQPGNEWLHDFIRGLALDEEPGRGRRPPTVALAEDLPAELRPGLPAATPAEADVGVVLAWGAVAETGTLLLTPDGGRAVQLLPPTLVVWVPAGRVLARLGEALPMLRDCLPAVVGLHSGPSKSADIGRTVVTGVHGPGRCIAVLEGDSR